MTSTRTEVPSGWAKSRFTELAVRRSGVKISKASKSIYQTNGKFPVVDQGQEMVAAFVDDDELQFPGQLPVIVFGDHTRIFKYVDFPFVPGADGTQIITPRLDRVDASFLYYALCNLPLTNLGYSRHFKLLKEHLICFPKNLCEQRKIAAILSSVDDAIEKTQAVIAQVQVVKRGLMQELLSRGLPGRHKRFKQTEIGEIPEEWSLSLLSDVVFFLEGPGLRKWLFRDRGMPFINIRCIRNDGTLDLSSVQYIAEDKAQNSYRHFFLEANDTVLSSSGTLGRMAVVREADLPLMLNTSVIRFRTLNDDVCATSYMRAFLSSEIFLNQVLRESQGSAQANFGPTHLRKVKIPLPPVAEQKVLSAAFTAPSERLMAERTKKKCLAKLKSALMAVLLTGELRVTPDPEVA